MSIRLWEPKKLWELPPCPYVNRSPPLSTLQKALYIIPGAIMFLPRLAVLSFSLFSVYGIAKLSVIGWETYPRPKRSLPTWRRFIQATLVPPLVRLNLFSLGFWNITVKGQLASRAEAPIIVSNHQTFLDIWVWLWQMLPVGVSAAENMRFPVMGEIMLAFQTIFVDREDHSSGSSAAQQIQDTVDDDRYPQVMVYPEGNTGNGTSVCAFKQGAFQPGAPVQVAVIEYGSPSWAPFDPAWVEPLGIPVHVLALRLLLQPYSTLTLTYLPPTLPTLKEKEHPAVFASRVQKLMAEQKQVPVSGYSFGDTALMFRARKAGLPPAQVLLEQEKATKVFGLGVTEAKECLEHFATGVKHELQPGAKVETASVKAAGLMVALGLTGKDTKTQERLLATFDQDSSGDVNFREFLAGLAPLAAAGPDGIKAEGKFYERATKKMLSIIS